MFSDIAIKIILGLLTAGLGAAAHAAIQGHRLAAAAEALTNIYKRLKWMPGRHYLPKIGLDDSVELSKHAQTARRTGKGMPEIESPRKKPYIEDVGKKEYRREGKRDGPKKTTKKQTGARELEYWDFDGAEKSYDVIRSYIRRCIKDSK